MYYIVFVVLLLFSTLHLSNDKKLYRVIWIVLTLILIFRYGQGTDYINYEFHYKTISRMLSVKQVSYYGLDIGYMFINKLFNMMGFSFQGFIGFISLFMMICLDRYIKEYSDKPVLTLLLFYPTYYLTYYSSAIAQGIVLAIFIGIMLDMLLKKKIAIYVVLCIAVSTIHLSGIVLFSGVLIYINSERVYRYVITISIFLSAVGTIIGSNIPLISTYYESPRLISLAEKVIWLIVLIYLSKRVVMNEKEEKCLKLYYTGFIVAVIFICFPVVSSRLCVYYKVLETGLFGSFLFKYQLEERFDIVKRRGLKYSLVALIIVAMTTSMFCKNINQYLNNGCYYDTSFFAYKYISIFEKDELYDYRNSIFRGMLE